jgi:hypothetical protein
LAVLSAVSVPWAANEHAKLSQGRLDHQTAVFLAAEIDTSVIVDATPTIPEKGH